MEYRCNFATNFKTQKKSTMKKLFAILAIAGSLTACNNAAPKVDAAADSAKIADSIAAAAKAQADTAAKAAVDTAVKAVVDTAKAAVKEAGAKVEAAAKEAVKK